MLLIGVYGNSWKIVSIVTILKNTQCFSINMALASPYCLATALPQDLHFP